MAEKRMREENRRVEVTMKERAMQQIAAKENAREAHDKHRKHFINTLDTINKEKVQESQEAHGMHRPTLCLLKHELYFWFRALRVEMT